MAVMALTMEQQKMVEENHNLIYGFATKNKINLDDFYDLLAIGLCKAVMNYDKDKNVTLASYAYSCMLNEMKVHWRSENQEKRLTNKNTESYDKAIDESGETFLNYFASSYDLEKEVVGNDLVDEMLYQLSDLEKKIVEGLLLGETRLQISNRLGFSKSYIEKKVSHIKNKLAKYNR